ncbi:MAG: gamma-glutamylcyclotransferase [Thermoplasmata archaeon]
MPWIFGYGSLMWDPFFPYLRRERAVLSGYHRAFVMAFARVWGRPEAPCVVLGLELGGMCEGVAYEVEAGELENIEEQLLAFEGDAFEVTRRTVFVADREVEATVALSRPSHQDYLGRVPEATRVAMVIQSRGPDGSCLEYVEDTAKSLERLGIKDQGVLRFLTKVKEAG